MNFKKSSLIVMLILVLVSLPQLVTMGKENFKNQVSTSSALEEYSSYLPYACKPDNPVFTEWSMVAGNPERTGWAADQLVGTPHVEWFRPIDAYIPPNFQVVAANNLVYVSSARGLYAMRYDTGEVVWRYDTEIPLGNSPTIARVNGVSTAVVGGYDKKIHAFDALTGEKLWEFTGAKAGFDANPLVFNNMVYIGNRDGYFYAINGTNGRLVWQYPAANQSGIGPIHLSPAYKNNTIYFATDYNYAYALNINGTLKWKSKKLVGDGYNSYWPVIYTDPESHTDYVIFSGNIPYREEMRPGLKSFENSSYPYGEGLDAYYRNITINDSWASGKTILDYSPSAEYFEQKPWHRIYTILNGNNGIEFTTDFDHDNRPEYFPVWPIQNPSTQPPPIIGPDQLIYIENEFQNFRSHVMGWKFGTPYFALSAINDAADEPMIISGGGNNLYRVLCCARTANYVSLSDLNGLSTLWPYGGNTLAEAAPGYDEKLHYLAPNNPLDNISVIFGNVNGIYGYHGDSNPMVPYGGKLFTIKGNSIIAFGNGTARGKLPLLSSTAQSQNVSVPTHEELVRRLEGEIRKIVEAGILKPGSTEDSQFGSFYRLLDNYFDNPADGLYTLSLAYPHLSASLQNEVKDYLKTTYYPKYFDPVLHFRIGWVDGVQRDSVSMPPELVADLINLPDDYLWNYDDSLPWTYIGSYRANPNIFYAMWKYAANVAPEDTQAIYQRAKAILTEGTCEWNDCVRVPPIADDARLIQRPFEANAYIAGQEGFLKLQELAGRASADAELRDRVEKERDRLRNLRVNNFSKDTPYTSWDFGYGRNFVNISRNFIFLTPELADYLRQSKLAAVQEALSEYYSVGPYWFVSKFKAAAAESGQQNLYDSPSIFAARAWILREPRTELYKYLDTPAFEIGDYFYIQNLIAVIEAR